MKRKIYITLHLLFLSLITLAQSSGQTEMADVMRSNGKIYVVTAVVLTIFAGLIMYLVRIERKMTRLEREDFTAKHN